MARYRVTATRIDAGGNPTFEESYVGIVGPKVDNTDQTTADVTNPDTIGKAIDTAPALLKLVQ